MTDSVAEPNIFEVAAHGWAPEVARPAGASLPGSASAQRTLIARVPIAALLLVLSAAGGLFVHQAQRVVRFPYPVDYGEGPLLDQSVRLAHFENIYDRDLTTPPYTVSNYPPLYPLLQTPWVRLFGPALWYGRLVSCVSIAIAALLLAAILRELTGDWPASAVGGSLLLCVPYVSYWAPLFRIDPLALALSLGALYAIVRAPYRRCAVFVAILLLASAAFTRQSYLLAAPAGAFVWLLTRDRNRRRAWELLAGLLGVVGAVFLSLNVATGGGFFFHTVTANLNEFHVERVWSYWLELGLLLPAMVAVGVAFAVIGPRLDRRSWSLVAPYLVGAALSALTVGKTGSNVNYFLELSVALALASGAMLAGLRARPMARNAVALLLLLQVSVLLGGTRYQRHRSWRLDQGPLQSELLRVVRESPGPVLADEDLGLLPLAGRPIELQPFELTRLAARGAWSSAPLLASLERREFGAILLYRAPGSSIHRTRWTPSMLAAIEHGYRPARTIGSTVVYRPRTAPSDLDEPGLAGVRR